MSSMALSAVKAGVAPALIVMSVSAATLVPSIIRRVASTALGLAPFEPFFASDCVENLKFAKHSYCPKGTLAEMVEFILMVGGIGVTVTVVVFLAQCVFTRGSHFTLTESKKTR